MACPTTTTTPARCPDGSTPLDFLLGMIRGIRDHRWFPDEAAARSPRGPGAGLGRVGIATGGVSLWSAARVLVGCANVPVARWLDDGQPGLQQRRVDHLVTVAIRQPFFQRALRVADNHHCRLCVGAVHAEVGPS